MKQMTLNFIGKDSVPFKNTYDIPDNVADILSGLMAGKADDAEVFSASSNDVNDFLKGAMDILTPKLFRTAWGARLLIQELQAHPCTKDMTLAQKKAVYNNAALAVSKKLNHQKNVSKTFDGQMVKMDDRLKAAVAKDKELTEKLTEDLKKIKKDISAAKKALTGERLEKRLAALADKKAKIEARFNRSKERVEKITLDKEFKKDTANIAINTAKTAYSTPEIAYSWCKDNGIDISFIYSKSLQAKYAWAADTPTNYWRKFPNV